MTAHGFFSSPKHANRHGLAPRYLLIGSVDGHAEIAEQSDEINACYDRAADLTHFDLHGILDTRHGVLFGAEKLNEIVDEIRQSREDDRAHDEGTKRFYRSAR